MRINQELRMSDGALALCESLRTCLYEANALDGTMSYQGHAFGKISDALVETIACALSDAQVIFFGDSRKIARRLHDEMIDNGENIAYQIQLWNDGIIS